MITPKTLFRSGLCLLLPLAAALAAGAAPATLADFQALAAKSTSQLVLPTYPVTPAEIKAQTEKTIKDADAAFDRAIQAGGTPLMPPTDQFYGYRMGSLLDPFGHKWMIQHPLQAVSVEEMQRRWDDMVRQFSAPKQN